MFGNTTLKSKVEYKSFLLILLVWFSFGLGFDNINNETNKSKFLIVKSLKAKQP